MCVVIHLKVSNGMDSIAGMLINSGRIEMQKWIIRSGGVSSICWNRRLHQRASNTMLESIRYGLDLQTTKYSGIEADSGELRGSNMYRYITACSTVDYTATGKSYATLYFKFEDDKWRYPNG